jgi:hypothetical protein
MVMIHPRGPETGADTDRVEEETGPIGSQRIQRPISNLNAGSVNEASYDSVNSLLDEDEASDHDTSERAHAATATVASAHRANRPNPSHADATMASSREMSGLRIFGRAALLVIAMGVGALIAAGAYYLSQRTPISDATLIVPEPELETSAADTPPTISPEIPADDPRPPETKAAAPEETPEPVAPADSSGEITPIALEISQTDPPMPTTARQHSTPVQLAMIRTALKPSLPASFAPESTVPKPAPRQLDTRARLADPMGKLKLPKIGLKDLSRLITSMSTVPISFGESAFAFGAQPNSQVAVAADDNPVGDVFDTALKRLHLVTRVDGQHLIVEHASAQQSESKVIKHDVSDLASSQVALSELMTFIYQFTDHAPTDGSVTTGGAGEGVLTVNATRAGHLRLALLLDRLRTARGITFTNRFKNSSLFASRPWCVADEKLDQRLTVRHEKPLRLDQLLGEIEERTGLHLLVDWRELDREGWNESTLVSSNMWQEPLRDILADVLAQLGVTYRIVLADTISITTNAAERGIVQTAFFPIDDLLENGQDLQHVIQLTKQSIGVASFRDQGGIGAIGFDAPSQTLVVQLPQSELRVVDQIMSNWRSL